MEHCARRGFSGGGGGCRPAGLRGEVGREIPLHADSLDVSKQGFQVGYAVEFEVHDVRIEDYGPALAPDAGGYVDVAYALGAFVVSQPQVGNVDAGGGLLVQTLVGGDGAADSRLPSAGVKIQGRKVYVVQLDIDLAVLVLDVEIRQEAYRGIRVAAVKPGGKGTVVHSSVQRNIPVVVAEEIEAGNLQPVEVYVRASFCEPHAAAGIECAGAERWTAQQFAEVYSFRREGGSHGEGAPVADKVFGLGVHVEAADGGVEVKPGREIVEYSFHLAVEREGHSRCVLRQRYVGAQLAKGFLEPVEGEAETVQGGVDGHIAGVGNTAAPAVDRAAHAACGVDHSEVAQGEIAHRALEAAGTDVGLETVVPEYASAESADGTEHQMGGLELHVQVNLAYEVAPRGSVVVTERHFLEMQVASAVVGKMHLVHFRLAQAHGHPAADVQDAVARLLVGPHFLHHGVAASSVEAHVVRFQVEGDVHISVIDSVLGGSAGVEAHHTVAGVVDADAVDGEYAVAADGGAVIFGTGQPQYPRKVAAIHGIRLGSELEQQVLQLHAVQVQAAIVQQRAQGQRGRQPSDAGQRVQVLVVALSGTGGVGIVVQQDDVPGHHCVERQQLDAAHAEMASEGVFQLGSHETGEPGLHASELHYDEAEEQDQNEQAGYTGRYVSSFFDSDTLN